jgi:hypothetical protein
MPIIAARSTWLPVRVSTASMNTTHRRVLLCFVQKRNGLPQSFLTWYCGLRGVLYQAAHRSDLLREHSEGRTPFRLPGRRTAAPFVGGEMRARGPRARCASVRADLLLGLQITGLRAARGGEGLIRIHKETGSMCSQRRPLLTKDDAGTLVVCSAFRPTAPSTKKNRCDGSSEFYIKSEDDGSPVPRLARGAGKHAEN